MSDNIINSTANNTSANVNAAGSTGEYAYVTKDSGRKKQFETGAQRDDSNGKPRFDRIPLFILNLLQFVFSGVWYRANRSGPLLTEAPLSTQTREDLIPSLFLKRLGGLYWRGATKYGIGNWEKGMPLSRYEESMLRHIEAWRRGDTSEDHLSAAAWNIAAIMVTEDRIKKGSLDEQLGDAGPVVGFLSERDKARKYLQKLSK
jgi:hypothetical protein